MDRWACVDLPAFPLQLLVQREPGWRGRPAAVVDRDGPQGKLLWINEAARRAAILPGMRFAAGLSLTRELMAGVVTAEEVGAGLAAVTERLRDFSPEIEPCAEEPGVFWLDAGGLQRLFPSASAWGGALHAALTACGYVTRVAVGFTRYGSYALAKGCATGQAPVLVVRTAADESERARSVLLARLGVDPALRDELDRLGVQTLGQFLELPRRELCERFEAHVTALHRLAAGAAWKPLEPTPPPEPLEEWLELETPDDDRERLAFWIKRLLDPLLQRAAARGDGVSGVRLVLQLDPSGQREEMVRAAAPTLDAALLLDLVRLRLAPPAGSGTRQRVAAFALALDTAPLTQVQAKLPETAPARDFAAADRALARVRAELGPAAVTRARMRDGHLPEATFLWEPLAQLPEPRPHPSSTAASTNINAATMIRRILARPYPLPPRVHNLRDDGWVIAGLDHGPVEALEGPYVIAGGWWMKPLHREYHFAQMQRGDLLWVYYDRTRRRWFWQGEVL